MNKMKGLVLVGLAAASLSRPVFSGDQIQLVVESEELIGRSIDELSNWLPQNYFVVTNTRDVPDELPDKIRFLFEDSKMGYTAEVWGMNESGRRWEPFLAVPKTDPHDPQWRFGFIYRRSERRGHETFVPVLRFDLDQRDQITSASQRWCERTVKHPPFGWRSDKYFYGNQNPS